MNKADKYFQAVREAKTIEELKGAYQKFMVAFNNNEISIEQYNQLRNAFHNMVILKF